MGCLIGVWGQRFLEMYNVELLNIERRTSIVLLASALEKQVQNLDFLDTPFPNPPSAGAWEIWFREKPFRWCDGQEEIGEST